MVEICSSILDWGRGRHIDEEREQQHQMRLERMDNGSDDGDNGDDERVKMVGVEERDESVWNLQR